MKCLGNFLGTAVQQCNRYSRDCKSRLSAVSMHKPVHDRCIAPSIWKTWIMGGTAHTCAGFEPCGQAWCLNDRRPSTGRLGIEWSGMKFALANGNPDRTFCVIRVDCEQALHAARAAGARPIRSGRDRNSAAHPYRHGQPRWGTRSRERWRTRRYRTPPSRGARRRDG